MPSERGLSKLPVEESEEQDRQQPQGPAHGRLGRPADQRLATRWLRSPKRRMRAKLDAKPAE